MDSAVKNFLKSVADTVLKLEIITYFHEHPYVMDNAVGLARWLNRRAGEVAADLDRLAEAGLLRRDGEGDSAVFSFSPDPETAAIIEKVVSSYGLTRETVQAEILRLRESRESLKREFQDILFNERGRTGTILDSMEEAVLVLSREGRVLLANGRFIERFARQEPGAQGKDIEGRLLEELLEEGAVAGAVRTSVAGASESIGEDIPLLFHRQRSYRLHSVPVTGPDGLVIADKGSPNSSSPAATVTVFHDVTRDRELERMREDFISMLTHDLKNPLGVILGSSQVILEKYSVESGEKQQRLLSNIVRSCATMERLIEDFLYLSRLEAGKMEMELEPVDMRALIETTIELFNPQAVKKRLAINVEADCGNLSVLADPVQLERVFSNLFGNAVKYNREGGKIDVRLESCGGAVVRVHLADTGRGIPAEEIPYIFEKFRRGSLGEVGGDTLKGTGLGLAIARELITAMGGEISVTSTQGQGACFSFSLPEAQAP